MLSLSQCVGRPEVGAKAETLARMRAVGLPTPEGIVLLPEEVVDASALQAALARLGGERFVVRSSASIEDRAGGSAAGLFESIVVGRDEVGAAVARVRASADSPPVLAYRQARGLGAPPRMAVLVQPYFAADGYGVVHSSAEGLVYEERAPGEPEWGTVRARGVVAGPEGEADRFRGALAGGVAQLRTLVGGPVEAEYARRGELLMWLQARPQVEVPALAAAPHFAEPGEWRLDGEHNPDPLSTAQASLVEYVDRLGVGPRQRVVDGYLYVQRGVSRWTRPIPLTALRQLFEEELVPDCAERLDQARREGTVEAALLAYAHLYRRYVGEVAPSLADARHRLDQLLRDQLGERLTAHAALISGIGGAAVSRDQALWQLGRTGQEELLEPLLERFGDHAPAWDVAVATDRERVDRVRTQAARLAELPLSPHDRHMQAVERAMQAASELAGRLDPEGRRAFKRLLPVVRDLLPLAEDDDLLFARAQATVRAALLRRAPSLPIDLPDDVFELTIDEVRAPSGDLRAAVERRRRGGVRVPPTAFVDGRPEWPTLRDQEVLRGAATFGQARGRALVVRSLATAPATLDEEVVLVVPAIVPALTPLLLRARALVTDYGGALSHGATLAREYGIPAVLGVGQATRLPSGSELYVDGAAGRVLVLDRPH